MKVKNQIPKRPYPSAKDVAKAEAVIEAAKNIPPSLRLAFTDKDFLLAEERRGVRLMLELEKAEQVLHKHEIEATVVIFGSARLLPHDAAKEKLEKAEADLRQDPDNKNKQMAVQAALSIFTKSHFYDEARKLGRLIAEHYKDEASPTRFVVATGGGPGIMEAANRGASDVGVDNVGFTIALPKEFPNVYSTPELTFQFHYFAVRKMHLLMRARALIVFPGGFGTLDELFETLTLMQTYKMEKMPILLFGRSFWERIINFDALVDEGVVAEEDLSLFTFVETAEEAWRNLVHYYGLESGAE